MFGQRQKKKQRLMQFHSRESLFLAHPIQQAKKGANQYNTVIFIVIKIGKKCL